jgi:hypothetical protein
MDHLSSILWLAFWPVLIYAIYRIALYAIKKTGYLYDDGDQE